MIGNPRTPRNEDFSYFWKWNLKVPSPLWILIFLGSFWPFPFVRLSVKINLQTQHWIFPIFFQIPCRIPKSGPIGGYMGPWKEFPDWRLLMKGAVGTIIIDALEPPLARAFPRLRKPVRARWTMSIFGLSMNSPYIFTDYPCIIFE